MMTTSSTAVFAHKGTFFVKNEGLMGIDTSTTKYRNYLWSLDHVKDRENVGS